MKNKQSLKKGRQMKNLHYKPQSSKNPQIMHFGFNIGQPEFFSVPIEDINRELEEKTVYQGDDVNEYL